jgi:hypothetical protein
VASFTCGSKILNNDGAANRPTAEANMPRLLPKILLLAVITFSIGGWVWLLGVAIKWLVVKL